MGPSFDYLSHKMFVLCLLLPTLGSALTADNHIVGGKDVDIAQYPWQGSYRTSSDSHTCGCVYVGGTWTLTAGHCGGSSTYTVGYGHSDRHSVTVYTIASVIRHPNYGQGNGFTPNDFAVVQTTETPSGINVSPGTIAMTPENPRGFGDISGWGRTCGDCALADTLQAYSNMEIISDGECSHEWGGSFNSQFMICVWSMSGSSCNGDSGGPLSVGSTIYGLTSWGIIGCNPYYPSVYAKVGAASAWFCSTTDGEAAGCQ